EMGVELQVLRRGTLFPMRARKLWEVYRAHTSLEDIAAAGRDKLERTIFRTSLSEVWAETKAFWAARDPAQIERAETDGKHKMALCFRWYLGQASRWANQGREDRKADFQVWCGPAIGAFNEWTRGTFLEAWQSRRAVPVALNVMHGAAVLGRLAHLRTQGVALDGAEMDLRPRPVGELEEFAL
ncbi:MAG: 2-nitropropane dioxygenase, partial [Myxococcota bacterium]